jgi:hypothetical protein
VKGDAFRVSFTSTTPAPRCASLSASVAVHRENLRDREVLAEGTNQFTRSAARRRRRRLVETEHKVEEYKGSDGQLPEQRDANMQGLHNSEMQLQALIDSLNRDRDRKLALERLIADLEAAEVVVVQTPAPTSSARDADGLPIGATAAQQLDAAQAVLQGMQMKLKDTHPDVQRQKRLIAELQKKVDAEALARPVSAPATAAETFKKNRLAEAGRSCGRSTRFGQD